MNAYAIRARQNAPNTIEETRAAAHRLIEEGFSDHGFAAALGLAIEQVRRMLGERGGLVKHHPWRYSRRRQPAIKAPPSLPLTGLPKSSAMPATALQRTTWELFTALKDKKP